MELFCVWWERRASREEPEVGEYFLSRGLLGMSRLLLPAGLEVLNEHKPRS